MTASAQATGLGQVMTMSTPIRMSALAYTQPESGRSAIGPISVVERMLSNGRSSRNFAAR
jgi:hypothetical protein